MSLDVSPETYLDLCRRHETANNLIEAMFAHIERLRAELARKDEALRELGSPEEAKAQGCIFYSMPGDLDGCIDPLILPVVLRINESGWVWTGESCQGHPDATHSGAAGVEPFLRLIVHRTNLGEMLSSLCDAMTIKSESGLSMPYLGFRLHNVTPDKSTDYAEVMVYAEARNAYMRNHGIAVLAAFADILCGLADAHWLVSAKCQWCHGSGEVPDDEREHWHGMKACPDCTGKAALSAAEEGA